MRIDEITRRNLLKGIGATAVAGALPKTALATDKLVIVMDNGKEFDLTDFDGTTAKEKWDNFGKAIKNVYSKHDTPVPSYVLKRGNKIIARSRSIGNVYR